jgi:transcriptional regulator with XRE-family HTH domain
VEPSCRLSFGLSITFQVIGIRNSRASVGSMASNPQSIGDHIRAWRQRRRMSQLDLALDADVSARHLSFIETGRARPSRDMVLNLAGRLEVPLREQNAMLLAAGFAPAFSVHDFDAQALAPAREAIAQILDAHMPYPALGVDRHWQLIAANEAALQLTEGVAEFLRTPPVNVLRMTLHPEGLAPRIVNLDDWRAHTLLRVQRDAFATGDSKLAELCRELASYGRPASPHAVPDGRIFLPLVLRDSDGGTLSFFSTITNFGTPADVTLAEISLEMFFPADAATRRAYSG